MKHINDPQPISSLWQEPRDSRHVVAVPTADQAGCVHELFEAQADRNPHHTAIISADAAYTYGELDAQANRFAHYLRANGVRQGDLIGVFFHRSEKPLIAILGILKSGAAYVPLDPAYPADRIAHILETTSMKTLVTEDSLLSRLPSTTCNVVSYDQQSQQLVEYPATRLSRKAVDLAPDDLSYILFTSGTTGHPKGIMTEHRNVFSFVLSFNQIIKLNSSDRVYQGFSLGFDGSVEEMWMALSNGASLIISTPEAAMQPNVAAEIMRRHGATVLSTVPTFLGLINEDVPSLRLIIVSGEACPPKLVDVWADDDRRVLNVYGPTEATVNSTAAFLKPGQKVTIGKPLAGYEVHVLDDKGHEVPFGEKGELYISGLGIARGYYNAPDLSAKAFLNGKDYQLDCERLYRTGDLVSRADSNDLNFHGRIDNQVKIRGFRVELGEIEAVLRQHANVKQACVTVWNKKGFNEVAAYLTLKAPDDSTRNELYRSLCQTLPSYMMPSYLDVLGEFPQLASGKINRKALPAPEAAFILEDREIVAPATDTEKILHLVWQDVLRNEQISVADDFFTDLGGYSLLAVEMITALREQHAIELSVRDVYENTTIRKLALLVANTNTPKSHKRTVAGAQKIFDRTPLWERWAVYGLMAISLAIIYGLAPLAGTFVLWAVFQAITGEWAVNLVVGLITAFAFLGYPLTLLFSIATKWLFVGRYKPGRYPLWSFYYFRVWLATKAQAASGISLLAGTPVMSLYCRLMGAKVGRNTIIDTADIVVYDMLSIGDNSTIGSETQIQGFRVEDGMLVLGRTRIGSNAFVGTHCYLGFDVEIGNHAALDDLSLLSDGQQIPSGEKWAGSPAVAGDYSLPTSATPLKKRRPFLMALAHIFTLETAVLVEFIAFLPFLAVVIGGFLWAGVGGAFAGLAFSSTFGVVFFCLFMALMKRVILPKLEPGIYDVHSFFYLRKWLVDALLSICQTTLHGVYTTIYLPPWLRLMGAKVGKNAEISNVSQVYPDLVDMGAESFFADGSLIGGRRFFNGRMQVDVTSVGRRSFVGNNARLKVGDHLGDNSLLGVMSSTKTPHPGDNTEWLGCPAFPLPHRVKNEEFTEQQTFKPTPNIVRLRYLIDGLRIMIPNMIGLATISAYLYFLYYAFTNLTIWETLAWSPVVSVSLMGAAMLSVPAIKWLVMGEFHPVRKPLWSAYVFLNEMINGIYETVGAPILGPLQGTPFFNWYLRLMGCDIGKHCYIGTTLFSEFDLVHIGDYVSLNTGVVVQNHLFEDRVMKSSHQYIENECSLGNMSVVLYDSVIKKGTKVFPLSLVMKSDILPEKTEWRGIPVQEVHEAYRSPE